MPFDFANLPPALTDIAAGDWAVLVGAVLALGMRHGLDADHLVAIDGLTRFNAAGRKRVAPWCGLLFSSGHSIVVLAVALVTGSLVVSWTIPRWLEAFGAWVSIVLLALLGILNIVAVLRTPADRAVELVGVKSSWLGRIQQTSNPLLIAATGSAFAFSFDTLSQAALFAMIGAQVGGWTYCIVLGIAFAAGMILVDACNGWWVFRLIARANRTALRASRIFGMAVALLSLGVAAWGLAKYLMPPVEAWSAGRELGIGLGVIGLVAISFVVAMGVSRPKAVAAGDWRRQAKR
jgi:high-affinity nickel-transport protein